MLIYKKETISDTPTWHKDLLNSAIKHKIITNKTANEIGKYLVFRHFFTHAYGFLIEEDKLEPLLKNISKIFILFKSDIDNYLSEINK